MNLISTVFSGNRRRATRICISDAGAREKQKPRTIGRSWLEFLGGFSCVLVLGACLSYDSCCVCLELCPVVLHEILLLTVTEAGIELVLVHLG